MLVKLAALAAVLALPGAAAAAGPGARIVELETPLAKAPPLQGYLRQPDGLALPAVVLLHSCNGNWKRLDERWGKRIADWGYVTLTVDSFGPRGIDNTCNNGAPIETALDAYRALNYLTQQSFVDAGRVAVLGFAQGGWLALTSVERGIIETTAAHRFRAAIAFYPPCRGFKDNMTVPTLILAGERDDWMPAEECRRLIEGRDDYGISRTESMRGEPIKLVVLPGAYHGFDAPSLNTPADYLGHHLAYDQSAAEQSERILHDFLLATIGGKDEARSKPDR